MSSAPVAAARERLLNFRLPERGIEYDARGFPVKLHVLERLLDRFASLAAAFARALEAAGSDAELKRRADRFEEFTASGTTFDTSRRAAYEDVKRAVEPFRGSSQGRGLAKPRRKISLTGSSPSASGWEFIADEMSKVERLVGDHDHILGHLPDALAYADRLVRLAPSGPEGTDLWSWRDELFRLKQQEDAGRLLGCRLIVRCRDELNQGQNSYDSYRKLIKLLSSDPPGFVRAVQDAAATLEAEVQETPRQAPSGKRSPGRRTPAKSEAAEPLGKPDNTIVTIERWADLAIGIHEKGFYALHPRPEAGDIVAITKARKLPLRGKRWPSVLKVFADSEYGTSARKEALLMELGYLRFGQARMAEALEEEEEGPPRRRGAETRYADKLREFTPHLDKLTATMADLGRELRDFVKCPESGPFESGHRDYQTAVVIGHLKKDAEDHLRFRRIPGHAL